ncbi:MAG: methyl-accepting chemotaxis protein [Desulfurivibrio sp.]
MTIVQKIFGGFSLIILVLILVGLANHLAVRDMAQQSGGIGDGLHLNVELAQREVDHLAWASRVRDFIGDQAAARLEVETDYRKCGFGLWYYGEGRRQAEHLVPALAPLLARIETPHRELHESAVRVERAALESGREQAARIYAAESVPALGGVQGLLREIRGITSQTVGSREEVANSTMRRNSLVVSGSLVLAALVAGMIGLLTWRGLVTIMGNIGREMRDGANQVSAASGEVSSSSQVLAGGASEQAASAEEISASLEEVTAMTRRDADNISQANQLMTEVGQVVSRADDSMQRLVTSMQEISAASTETQKIVKTIDEIAFQTNLLALNAAVEAARAGEAGAGFAVVADEVRNLAMRAAEAARNTSSLIDGTVGRIKSGSSLVDETSSTFKTSAESITRISTLIREIAESSAEQSRAVSQVSAAIGEIDAVIQRNAATAEESASSSEELSAKAEVLRSMVSQMIRVIGGIDAADFDAGQDPKLQRPPSMAGHRRALPAAKPEKKRLEQKKQPAGIIPMDDSSFEDF